MLVSGRVYIYISIEIPFEIWTMFFLPLISSLEIHFPLRPLRFFHGSPVVQRKTELRAHRSDGLTSGRQCGAPCGVPGYQCFPRRELLMAKTYPLR